MINFSIWEFGKFNDLQEFVKVVNDNKLERRTSGKMYGSLSLKNEITPMECLNNISVSSSIIDKDEIEYVAFNINAQGAKKNIETDAYEVSDCIEKAVGYIQNKVLKVVIFGSQNNAYKIIKKVFSNELTWGTVEEVSYISEDTLYWLFYRLREFQDEKITTNPVMFINGIYSYLGRTNDKVNAVRGMGNRVSALLGTLGMLLGEENLRALRPIIQYGNHQMNIELYIGNTGRIYDKTYRGSIEITQEGIEQIKLVLLVCAKILPDMVKAYKESCQNNEWSAYIKRIFLKGISNEMQDKIKIEMDRIDREIARFKEDNEEVDGTEELSQIENELLEQQEFE